MPKDEELSNNFVLKKEHIKLLKRAYISWNHCEYGAPEINPKRPYGNSNVEEDIAEILGWELEGDDGYDTCLSSNQRALAHKLHKETEDALREVLQSYPLS